MKRKHHTVGDGDGKKLRKKKEQPRKMPDTKQTQTWKSDSLALLSKADTASATNKHTDFTSLGNPCEIEESNHCQFKITCKLQVLCWNKL